MQEFAKEIGGKCLSIEYINDNVKRGHWCPDCYNIRRSATSIS